MREVNIIMFFSVIEIEILLNLMCIFLIILCVNQLLSVVNYFADVGLIGVVSFLVPNEL
jgi:hypothetical protein